MDLGKKITVHDMTLRDGMHPKRHLMTLEQMKPSPPGSTQPACR
jgi:4-hydroxy-2-oxovalerate/4-hydroxy-2-oxohexanoate aldolase